MLLIVELVRSGIGAPRSFAIQRQAVWNRARPSASAPRAW